MNRGEKGTGGEKEGKGREVEAEIMEARKEEHVLHERWKWIWMEIPRTH